MGLQDDSVNQSPPDFERSPNRFLLPIGARPGPSVNQAELDSGPKCAHVPHVYAMTQREGLAINGSHVFACR